jgi:hypothetical protein
MTRPRTCSQLIAHRNKQVEYNSIHDSNIEAPNSKLYFKKINRNDFCLSLFVNFSHGSWRHISFRGNPNMGSVTLHVHWDRARPVDSSLYFSSPGYTLSLQTFIVIQ